MTIIGTLKQVPLSNCASSLPCAAASDPATSHLARLILVLAILRVIEPADAMAVRSEQRKQTHNLFVSVCTAFELCAPLNSRTPIRES